uniref:Photosystem I assembly protein Ycf4 n=1 Tax=Polysiphonia sertularioides TaxID=945028 RepID=A0A1Z1MGL1_9FLOR|nr:photosystem I assembly protein [Polysiphonia sertularioides]
MTIKKYKIKGSRRFSNYWWASFVLIGGISFFFVGIVSYISLKTDIVFKVQNISFIPQGAVMTFYGTTGIFISLFLWYTIVLDIGGGYNEFNKFTDTITIFRLGFPGKNRILKLTYKLEDVKSIKISIQDGLSPKREIYLKMKDKRQIPLTKVSGPISINDIETQAREIAMFLDLSLEGMA